MRDKTAVACVDRLAYRVGHICADALAIGRDFDVALLGRAVA